MIMNIIVWIVVGFIIGALAKFVMPGRDPGGFVVTTLLGIAGSFVGGYLSSIIGIGGGFIVSLIFGVVGAVILLAIYRMIRK